MMFLGLVDMFHGYIKLSLKQVSLLKGYKTLYVKLYSLLMGYINLVLGQEGLSNGYMIKLYESVVLFSEYKGVFL